MKMSMRYMALIKISGTQRGGTNLRLCLVEVFSEADLINLFLNASNYHSKNLQLFSLPSLAKILEEFEWVLGSREPLLVVHPLGLFPLLVVHLKSFLFFCYFAFISDQIGAEREFLWEDYLSHFQFRSHILPLFVRFETKSRRKENERSTHMGTQRRGRRQVKWKSLYSPVSGFNSQPTIALDNV